MILHAGWDLIATAPMETARELRQDLKYCIRLYRGRSAGAAFAVAALGLAIGASTGVFSVLNALLLRGLPFSDPDQLVELWKSPVGAGNGRAAFTAWQGRNPYPRSAAAFSASEMNLAGQRDAMRVKVAETSPNFFELLGTRPSVGRTFAPDEDLPGQASVAVISHSLWQQWFGGVPAVAGASLVLNGALFTVIGVAPPRFDYPGNTGIWIPRVFDFEKAPKRGAFLFQTIGRLKLGIHIDQARKLFDAEVRRSDPQNLSAGEPNRARMVPLRDQLAGSVHEASWILAGMVLFVLLTASANVAQLLLSRTMERRQELEIRAALGASPARLMQQLITEAAALTAASAAIGLLVANWAALVATSVAPPQLATQTYTVLDWRVLGFSAALALLIAVVFGGMPAWLVGRLQPSGQITRTRRMRAGLSRCRPL
jgi:predicted permease